MARHSVAVVFWCKGSALLWVHHKHSITPATPHQCTSNRMQHQQCWKTLRRSCLFLKLAEPLAPATISISLSHIFFNDLSWGHFWYYALLLEPSCHSWQPLALVWNILERIKVVRNLSRAGRCDSASRRRRSSGIILSQTLSQFKTTATQATRFACWFLWRNISHQD